MKKLLALALTASMALGMAACGNKPAENSGAPVEPGLLRTAVVSDIKTMDVTKTTQDYMIPMNIFDRLFEVQVQADGSSQIVKSLCSDYSVSEDGLTYDFTLREGVVFSNGNPLTAADVLYSFTRLRPAGGVNDEVAMKIKGAAAVRDGSADALEGFQITGDNTFTITLEKPNAGFLAELTGPAMSIVDEETMQNVQNFGSACEDTIGSGPYKVTEWVVNDHYTLEYNDRYWGEAPEVKKVIVSVIPDASTQNLMFQSGELDILDLEFLDAAIVKSTYKTQYADSLLSVPRVGLMYLAMNQENEFLGDVNVRKAIQMAIDVDSIITSVFDGDAYRENGIIPKGIWGHNENLEPTSCDVEGAKALLQQAGYTDGQIHFTLALDSSASSNIQLIYQIVQQQLKEVGIEAEIATYDSSSWLDLRKAGKMDAYISKWTMDYNDPANIMATFFDGPESTRVRSMNYSNQKVMERVSAASAITDDEKRMEEYQALEKQIISEDAAWVPMLGNTHLFALGERVESFVPNWAGYSDFNGVNVNLK